MCATRPLTSLLHDVRPESGFVPGIFRPRAASMADMRTAARIKGGGPENHASPADASGRRARNRSRT